MAPRRTSFCRYSRFAAPLPCLEKKVDGFVGEIEDARNDLQ